VPASSGVKAFARVWGSTARRVCPRVEFGCRSQRTASSSEKRAPSGKGGAWTGAQLLEFRKRFPGAQRRRQPVPWWQSHGAGVGQRRVSERASPGQRSSRDGRHSRLFLWSFVHADDRMAVLAAPRTRTRASATSPWERRQGCQRQGEHASRREDNARRDDQPVQRGRAARRSESHCRGTGDSSIALARKRSMQENQRCAGTGTKK